MLKIQICLPELTQSSRWLNIKQLLLGWSYRTDFNCCMYVYIWHGWRKTQHHFTPKNVRKHNNISQTTLEKTQHFTKHNITERRTWHAGNTRTLFKTQRHYTKCIITTGNTMTWPTTQRHDTKCNITQNKTTLCKTQLNCILMHTLHILLMGILNKQAWHKMTLVVTQIEIDKLINMI